MSYSFEIKTSLDLLKKLKDDYADLENDILSSRHAINCAMTAWHLTDWVFVEYRSKHGYSDLGTFRSSLSCPSLKLMHDIANGGKHLIVTRPKSGITDTEVVQGDFASSDFDFNDFWVGSLELRMDDGSIKDFYPEITMVVNFWENYLNSFNHP